MSTTVTEPDPLLVDCPVCGERSGMSCLAGTNAPLVDGADVQCVHTGRRMRARRLAALPVPVSALDVGAWLRGGTVSAS